MREEFHNSQNILHKIFILQFRLLCNTLLIWFYSSRHFSAFIRHLQVSHFFWPKLLVVLPFVILLKFLFNIFRHNFSHHITPVSLLCCRLLAHPCPAFAVTSVFCVYVAPSSAHSAPSTVREDVQTSNTTCPHINMQSALMLTMKFSKMYYTR
jgi:hypothetical protein